jgi:Transcription factor WhiB
VPRSLSAETAQLPKMPGQLADGLCTRHPHPDWWSSTSPAERAAAQRVCRRCPVVRICFAWALNLPTTDTLVWAGLSAAQRRRLQRQARAS